MTRSEFMNELEKLLKDISQGEREEALKYYKDYFDDAQIMVEDSIPLDMVSPQKAASDIIEGINDNKDKISNDKTSKNNTMLIIVIILAATCMIWGPVALSVVGAFAGIVIGVMAVAISLLAIGFALLFTGFGTIATSVYLFMLLEGISLICITVGLLFTTVFILIIGKLIPLIVKGIVFLYKKICEKVKEEKVYE
ncbi:MAG: DUF1700 domain-containing protein [Eubacterium sp.]